MEQLSVNEKVQLWLEGYDEIALQHGLTRDELAEGLLDRGYDGELYHRYLSRYDREV